MNQPRKAINPMRTTATSPIPAPRIPRAAYALAAIALAALPLSGCIVAAAGAAAGYGANEYINGQATGVASAGLDRTWRATIAAIDQLKLNLKAKTKDSTTAEFSCTTFDGTGVTISLSRRSGDFTAIIVKVGLFGDEPKSREIIAAIKGNL